MSMMGSVGGAPGISFEDVIGMLKDEPAYQTKLRELQKRTEEAKAVMVQAVEMSRKTEENKKLVQSMLDQTTQQVLEANATKAVAEKLTADANAHEREMAERHAAWQKQADAELDKGRSDLRDAFATREKEVSAKEQDLLTKQSLFESLKADNFVVMEAFKTFKAETEAKLAQREATVREGESKLIANLQEVEATKAVLKEKLDKIKSISVG